MNTRPEVAAALWFFLCFMYQILVIRRITRHSSPPSWRDWCTFQTTAEYSCSIPVKFFWHRFAVLVIPCFYSSREISSANTSLRYLAVDCGQHTRPFSIMWNKILTVLSSQFCVPYGFFSFGEGLVITTAVEWRDNGMFGWDVSEIFCCSCVVTSSCGWRWTFGRLLGVFSCVGLFTSREKGYCLRYLWCCILE